MNVLSWAGVVIGSLFLVIIIICYIRHLIVFGIDLPCSTLKTDYFGRPYPETNAQLADKDDAQNFDPDEAARGNKYYPILTAAEARRSSASASTLKHLLEDSNSKNKSKITALDSSIDEEEADSPQNSFQASQIQEDEYSDTLGTLEETKEGDSVNSGGPDQLEDQVPTNGASIDPKSTVIDIHENTTCGKDVKPKYCVVHLDEQRSPGSDRAKRSDSQMSYHQKFFQVPRISCDEASTDDRQSPVLLKVPDPNFMQPKFSRNKSKSLREYKQRLGSVNACDDKKRLSLDRFLTAQCQYCMIEEMVANSMAKKGIKPAKENIAGPSSQHRISRVQSFDTPACVRTSPIPAMTLTKTHVERNDQNHFNHKQSDLVPSTSTGIGHGKTATVSENSHNQYAGSSSQTGGLFNHSAQNSKYEAKGIEIVTRDNLPVFDSRRTSCESTGNPLYKRQSPSNSFGGPEDPCNTSLLHPNLQQMRRTRSTRERRTSPRPSVNTSTDQRMSRSPRGGSFRDKRTTRRKSSPRLTSFEDFQNFSLLMAGHKVEIPSWKEHKQDNPNLEEANNSSQDGDVSS